MGLGDASHVELFELIQQDLPEAEKLLLIPKNVESKSGWQKMADSTAIDKVLNYRVCGSCKDIMIDWKSCPCGKIYFCDEVCQRSAWKYHKRSCSRNRSRGY